MVRFDKSKITQLRLQNGWSKRKLAKKMECKRQSIIQWESGAVRPHVDSISKLAEVGGVSVEYFFAREM